VTLPPFQALIDSHAEAVHRFLTASVGPVEADDCFQDTFIAALRAYPRLRPDSDVRAWLFTVARSKAMDTHRGRTRRPVPMAELPEPAGAPGADQGAWHSSELWDAVGELPEKQRAAVTLRFAGDLSHREIGRVLECSDAAARRSVHEGIKRLREVAA
jgi:RNA polymerase sigma factor (sigma-70 family)